MGMIIRTTMAMRITTITNIDTALLSPFSRGPSGPGLGLQYRRRTHSVM